MTDAVGFETAPRLADPDGFYARLIAMHEALDPDASNRLNARIILMMANQIGDDEIVAAILRAAAAAGSGD